MVEVRHLSHRFGSKEVLKDIDLMVDQGEILAIMGSSGGGKTTLLKCMAGLLRPTKGQVLVDGFDVATNYTKAQSRLGLVFQYAALFDYLNVAENVIFGLSRKVHLSRKRKAQIVAERLEEVGLAGTQQLFPSELSGGMRKRVGLARALAMEPTVLLYDEPTSGLDPVTAYSIDSLIVETRDRLNMTSIVVSHDVNSVFRVADRIAFLHAGSLLFVGTSEEFRDAQTGPIRELVETARAERLVEDLQA